MSVNKLRDGDYYPDGQGGFAAAAGGEEVLERVLFRLMARRGQFPLLPEVGSRLYLLPREKASARQAMATSYAAEALAGENVTVTRTDWDQESRRLTVWLTWQGEALSVQATI